jgi:hypothetical protein
LEARRGGEKKAAMARRYGLSETRITQMLSVAQKLEARARGGGLELLSNRAVGVLAAEGIHTMQALKARLASGLDLSRLPNCGVKTMNEIIKRAELS